ncbi:hypothetical protein [Pseudogracilibacillus auburnensis]|uniref:hypothetical protein n=1 Tax=Pseudogracilibacillus auburnensis TaxID=1494959 RepID=UPI001A963B44|nr:hypothetical protein [Pseudogracilibacillus auburnensis]MBO1005760.1 hypothetical protein [Pseudogracilibacillus auburnensis]
MTLSKESSKYTRKKKTRLYIGKETYGAIPKEEAFNIALEPYFNNDLQFKK